MLGDLASYKIWCDYAWLPAGPTPDVEIDITDGRITAIQTGRRTFPPYQLDETIGPG